MAAASSAPFFGLGDTQMPPPGQNPNPALQPPPAAAPAPKKKRNQPGNPNPDAEVIALSPKTLMATNRFVCEVCNKGFQREQNLQLHRRGHNLPWKLKQKNPKEARRRVYLCPEPSCVHHDPSRALGDLTGIKKHYCRKHGEKKWRCDKCSKRYAVQSDWKAHSKTCGTREYRCDCGTLFSRRDSFITHRAFCDALAQENVRVPPIGAGVYGCSGNISIGFSGAMTAPQLPPAGFSEQVGQPSASAGDVLRLGGGNAGVGVGGGSQFDHLMASSSGASMFRSHGSSSSSYYLANAPHHAPAQEYPEDGQAQAGHGGSLLQGKPAAFHDLMQLPVQHQQSSNGNILNLGFLSGSNGVDQFNGSGGQGGIVTSGALAGSHLGGGGGGFPPLYNSSEQAGGLPQMSATALLQKAAQIGATTSSYTGGGGASSLLRGASAGGEGPTANERSYQNLILGSMASGSGGAGYAAGSFAGASAFGGAVDDGKLSTRDFLGVGVVQGMSGSAAMGPPRHGAAGLHVGSLDPENMN
ncbi:protein indeterminate-domain 5, chloroplastic-like [Oryza brachyantha]|uniref:Protein EARLY HEADING DATE 2 n=1 Tax=Oryza brachyantha TaxID=4533 RepID=J3N001_ORYBR|nr:protein indeterminate-domain 5, chloroplastic-like [Oryza brachyantha]XP_040383811.1 protein indeterminate-domain 5, chloroplastic-like [Oryza brachyantha]XP_040383812.1 protein indeterminate-domain 5, chloroplastic-like [Oryza brachyantha]XP_040383813.1 protein indeterminate-domain 5, chloroplastic-like [Oryza brachyantha]